MTKPRFYQAARDKNFSKCFWLVLTPPDLAMTTCLYTYCTAPVHFAKQNIFGEQCHISQQLLNFHPSEANTSGDLALPGSQCISWQGSEFQHGPKQVLQMAPMGLPGITPLRSLCSPKTGLRGLLEAHFFCSFPRSILLLFLS